MILIPELERLKIEANPKHPYRDWRRVCHVTIAFVGDWRDWSRDWVIVDGDDACTYHAPNYSPQPLSSGTEGRALPPRMRKSQPYRQDMLVEPWCARSQTQHLSRSLYRPFKPTLTRIPDDLKSASFVLHLCQGPCISVISCGHELQVCV